MLRIAICDDEPKIVDEIERCINSYNDKNIVFQIIKFYDGEELINSEMKFDIVFLDIEMKRLDGIKAAQRVREVNMTVPIVYITNYEKYWRSAYDVHAFDFIEKNKLNKEKIHKVISDFIRSIKDFESAVIKLTTENGVRVQNTNEIYYFLVDSKKKIVMYTLNGEYVVKENLFDVYNKLDKFAFYESHRSCILNLKYVAHLDDYDVIMTNGEFVPLAQRKKKEFMEKLHNYLQSK